MGYECSGCGVGYQFRARPDRIVLDVAAAGSDILFHVLLPSGSEPKHVTRDGRDVAFRPVAVEQSQYADFEASVEDGAHFELILR